MRDYRAKCMSGDTSGCLGFILIKSASLFQNNSSNTLNITLTSINRIDRLVNRISHLKTLIMQCSGFTDFYKD